MSIENFQSLAVKTVMTTDVQFVAPDITMDRVAEFFDSHNIHHLPVVKDGKVVGMISKLDYMKILHGLTLFHTRNSKEVNSALLQSLLAKEVMTSNVATIGEDQTLQVAADMFKENIFHALPVVDENGQLEGIITTYDLLVRAYSTSPFLD